MVHKRRLWGARPALMIALVYTGLWSRPAELSFASAPLFHASRQRMQDQLQSNRQRLAAVHARWRLHSKVLKQRGPQQLQHCSTPTPSSLLVEAAAMRFIWHARQAYQLVPAVAMC